MNRFLKILWLLSLMTGVTLAQNEEGWEVVERCLNRAFGPPREWTFDGTILMKGWSGIHAIESGNRTPFVTTFGDFGSDLDIGLSPNNHWYATLEANITIHENGAQDWDITNILVYSTNNTREIVKIPRRQRFTFADEVRIQMRWLDNENLILAKDEVFTNSTTTAEVIHIPDGETQDWAGNINPLMNARVFIPSPDWMVAVAKPESVWGIYDITSGELLNSLDLAASTQVAWTRDIAFFAAEVVLEDKKRAIGLFIPTGRLITTIFEISDGYELSDIQWSANGDYLSVEVVNNQTTETHLYIVDIARHRVLDTCIVSPGISLIWSPQDAMFAWIDPTTEQARIIVVDVSLNRVYRIGYHTGAIIGWRENDGD